MQRIDPADPVALGNLAWFAARAGHPSEALGFARRAAALPGAPRATWRALERLAVGRTDGLVLASSSAPGHPSASLPSPLAAAVAAHRQAAIAVAEACYHAALGDPTLAAAAWNGLGVLHEQRGERRAADEAWRHALDQPSPTSTHNHALALLRRGDLPAARRAVAQGEVTMGGHAPLLFLAGYLAFLDGDPATASLTLERALAIEPDLARAQFTLGLVHQRLGRIDAALVAIRRGLLLSPWYAPQVWLLESQPGAMPVELAGSAPGEPGAGDTDAVMLALGRSLLEAGHLGEALALFDQVLLRRPEHTAALFHRGVVLAKLRRYQEALEDWDVVERAEPDGVLAAASRRHARSARQLAELFAPT
jgi:tetratricopeptide (TPR) repeat protein